MPVMDSVVDSRQSGTVKCLYWMKVHPVLVVTVGKIC